MTDRALAYAIAFLVVGLALAAMFAAHERHYKNRRWQLLEARIGAIERIVVGEHE